MLSNMCIKNKILFDTILTSFNTVVDRNLRTKKNKKKVSFYFLDTKNSSGFPCALSGYKAINEKPGF